MLLCFLYNIFYQCAQFGYYVLFGNNIESTLYKLLRSSPKEVCFLVLLMDMGSQMHQKETMINAIGDSMWLRKGMHADSDESKETTR